MKINKTIPQIFHSYAIANHVIANIIGKDFKAVGVNLLQDKSDLKYRNSIK